MLLFIVSEIEDNTEKIISFLGYKFQADDTGKIGLEVYLEPLFIILQPTFDASDLRKNVLISFFGLNKKS